jgi:hypothetical protein
MPLGMGLDMDKARVMAMVWVMSMDMYNGGIMGRCKNYGVFYVILKPALQANWWVGLSKR